MWFLFAPPGVKGESEDDEEVCEMEYQEGPVGCSMVVTEPIESYCKSTYSPRLARDRRLSLTDQRLGGRYVLAR